MATGSKENRQLRRELALHKRGSASAKWWSGRCRWDAYRYLTLEKLSAIPSTLAASDCGRWTLENGR